MAASNRGSIRAFYPMSVSHIYGDKKTHLCEKQFPWRITILEQQRKYPKTQEAYRQSTSPKPSPPFIHLFHSAHRADVPADQQARAHR